MFCGLNYPPSTFQNPTMDRPPALGRVYYVASVGVNTNNGLDPGTPFQTITYALTQCVNGHNDYIVVMDNTSANEPAWPIVVDVGIVHIIGRWGEPYPEPSIRAVGAGNPCFQLAAPFIEIAGLELGAGDATAPIIQSPAGPGTIGEWWIHHCTFGWLNGVSMGLDGIYIQNTHDAPQCVIEDNWFNGPLAGSNGLAQHGIHILGNATRSIIRRNFFRGLTGGIGILCVQNGSDIGAILDNVFKVPDLANGEAITMSLGVGNALISGNQAGGQDNAMAVNPYRDLSTGVAGTSLNAWGNNYADTTPTLPVIV